MGGRSRAQRAEWFARVGAIVAAVATVGVAIAVGPHLTLADVAARPTCAALTAAERSVVSRYRSLHFVPLLQIRTPDDRPSFAGERASLRALDGRASFPVLLPHTPIACSKILVDVWVDRTGSGLAREVVLRYASGVELFERPGRQALSRPDAEALAREVGRGGRAIRVGRTWSLAVAPHFGLPPDGHGWAGSIVSFDIVGTEVLIERRDAPYSTTALRRVAASLR